MLTAYLQAALRRAHYEIVAEDGLYYGEIRVCPGVYATAPTLEECRQQLQEVLEEWVLFRVHRHLKLPVVDGVKLAVKKEAV
ncbi:MAG TPA: type II toxin-antitoxin system HicB family antitoxin [Planctomycetaceae bacterium]|nr:type II toxin-antitoxin system HicB family antitoxin [Planctomycetaceae bacterium]